MEVSLPFRTSSSRFPRASKNGDLLKSFLIVVIVVFSWDRSTEQVDRWVGTCRVDGGADAGRVCFDSFREHRYVGIGRIASGGPEEWRSSQILCGSE